MARTTVASLLARIEALEEEVAMLRLQAPDSPISFVVSLESKPAPLPGPISFTEMAESQGLAYAYSDPEWWGANAYL